jgi:hypothetical protein
MKKHSGIWYGILILSILGIAGLAAVLVPQVRQFMISMAERYLIHRKVNYPERWMNSLVVYMRSCIALILAFDFFALTAQGQRMAKNIAHGSMAVLKDLLRGKFLKFAALMFGIYVLGISSIIRANFLYVDDMGRTVEGYKGWINWSRYVSQFLSMVIHADTNLTDISPLPQLIAALFMAISSVLLVYILCGKKITIIPLLASTVLGLSPYFLGCFSYKFDSPYMALSVLVSIIPFLFLELPIVFVSFSVVSLLIMCMTYQASSGIYLLLAISLCFQKWNTRQLSNKGIILFALRAIGAYIITLLTFRLLFMVPVDSYVSTGMFPLRGLLPGVMTNISKYTAAIYADFALGWKILIVICCLCFIIQTNKESKRNKVIAAIVSAAMIVILFILSAGAYLALRTPEFSSHSMYGVGVFAAIIAMSLVQYRKKHFLVFALALNWSFFIFSFSYGNALAEQKRYIDFRTEILLQDLNTLFPKREKKDMYIQLENSAGFAPSIANIAKHYPVIKRLVPQYLSGGGLWGIYSLVQYYNWGKKEIMNHRRNPGSKEIFVDFAELNLPVIFDSFYHTIQTDGERILVVLKN